MKSILLTMSQIVWTFFLYFLGAFIIGVALFPAVLFVISVWHSFTESPLFLKIFFVCWAIAVGYFLFGLSLIFCVGLLRMVLRIRLRPGDYKIGSSEMLKWFFVNALFVGVRTVFMDFMLLTPFCSLFYRMMGAKSI